jgi:hypothetical protein
MSWNADGPYRNGHIRDIFVNSAVDESLARAIFDTISTAKTSARMAPLENLIVRPAGGQALYLPSYKAPAGLGLVIFLKALAQEWFLERDQRDDSRDSVYATELSRHNRERNRDEGFRPFKGGKSLRYSVNYGPITRPAVSGGTTGRADLCRLRK